MPKWETKTYGSPKGGTGTTWADIKEQVPDPVKTGKRFAGWDAKAVAKASKNRIWTKLWMRK